MPLPAFARRTPRCSNRSICPARRAHSSKPAAADLLLWTDRRTDTVPFHTACSRVVTIIISLIIYVIVSLSHGLIHCMQLVPCCPVVAGRHAHQLPDMHRSRRLATSGRLSLVVMATLGVVRRAPDGALCWRGARDSTRSRHVSRRRETWTRLDRTQPLSVEIDVVDYRQRLCQT